jgi:hypothetical protein
LLQAKLFVIKVGSYKSEGFYGNLNKHGLSAK